MHDVLTRLKAEPQRFPKLDILYSPDRPVTETVAVHLPQNGIRLRFDGPEQRLRLVEVIDFSKSHITFKDRDLVRPANGASANEAPVPGESSAGPSFRHIYHRLLGPTYAGEFVPGSGQSHTGIYVLSYPGVAFNFSIPASSYSPDKDVVSLLDPSGHPQIASSMAIFSGDSWADARPTLWTEVLPSVRLNTILPRTKDVHPDEVSLVRLHGGGKIQLFRKWTNQNMMLTLGETTAQELVSELGPPSAIYRKHDQKMVVHKLRTTSNTWSRPSAGSLRPDDLTDTDHSSMNTGSDDSDDEAAVEDAIANPSGECFYNYFYLGFDILLSTPVSPSPAPPGEVADAAAPQAEVKNHQPDRLVATKLVLHGNVPGSYEFNRHRRCRWDIPYLSDTGDGSPATSESVFADLEDRMQQKWGGGQHHRSDAQPRQRGMVLNRGWGDSPGSSVEFLGGWEESGGRRAETNGDSTTTLYGFPGMVFEVLKNGYVNTVTVF